MVAVGPRRVVGEAVGHLDDLTVGRCQYWPPEAGVVAQPSLAATGVGSPVRAQPDEVQGVALVRGVTVEQEAATAVEHQPFASQRWAEHDRLGGRDGDRGPAGRPGTRESAPRARWWPGRPAGEAPAPAPREEAARPRRRSSAGPNWASSRESHDSGEVRAPGSDDAGQQGRSTARCWRAWTRCGRTSRRRGWRSSPSSSHPTTSPPRPRRRQDERQHQAGRHEHVEVLAVRVVEDQEDDGPEIASTRLRLVTHTARPTLRSGHGVLQGERQGDQRPAATMRASQLGEIEALTARTRRSAATMTAASATLRGVATTARPDSSSSMSVLKARSRPNATSASSSQAEQRGHEHRDSRADEHHPAPAATSVAGRGAASPTSSRGRTAGTAVSVMGTLCPRMSWAKGIGPARRGSGRQTRRPHRHCQRCRSAWARSRRHKDTTLTMSAIREAYGERMERR